MPSPTTIFTAAGQFIWPENYRCSPIPPPPLDVPQIDLQNFDPTAAKIVDHACRNHGFFVVVNHGFDMKLIEEVHHGYDFFFKLPLEEKKKARRKAGDPNGYSSSYPDRFATKLPWKETLTFYHSVEGDIERFFMEVMEKQGEELHAYAAFGRTLQKYREAVHGLCMKVVEVLGVSLGVGGEYFKEFFKDHDSITRFNHYPSCPKPELTMGTGPHYDPTAVTILHQDHVPGLEVFVDGEWRSIAPNPQAFVVNIGDTFTALSNGIYKGCLHRAVVNRDSSRNSVAFFLCPSREKLVCPLEQLVSDENPRMYPDFTWPELLEFTQKHHRADEETLGAFVAWIQDKEVKHPN